MVKGITSFRDYFSKTSFLCIFKFLVDRDKFKSCHSELLCV